MTVCDGNLVVTNDKVIKCAEDDNEWRDPMDGRILDVAFVCEDGTP